MRPRSTHGQSAPADGDRLLRLIDEGLADEPGEAMPWAVLEGLQRLIPCDRYVAYPHYAPHERRCRLTQEHVRERLGVHTAAAAVATASQLSPPPPPERRPVPGPRPAG